MTTLRTSLVNRLPITNLAVYWVIVKAQLASLSRSLLARKNCYSFNLHLYKVALRGMGILNSDSEQATGEPWFQHWLESTIKPTVVLDVGANDQAYGDGVFSLATIYAFEPHPKSFKRLQKNSSKQVKPVWGAVGKKNGKCTLWDFADDAPRKSEQPTSQLATLHKDVIAQMYDQPATTYHVPSITLDTFCQKNNISSVDLVKIDAEGNELAVIEGAHTLIKKEAIKVIQFEFNEMHAFSGVHMKDILTLLSGYIIYRLLPNALLPLPPYRPLTHEIYGFQNIVAIKHSLAKKLQLT